MYAINCPVHGIVIAYPTGWREHLMCSECVTKGKTKLDTSISWKDRERITSSKANAVV